MGFVRAKKLEKGHLLKCLFRVGLFVRDKKLKKGHLLKCLFRVGLFVRAKKLRKGHLLKCTFGIVCEGQTAVFVLRSSSSSS